MNARLLLAMGGAMLFVAACPDSSHEIDERSAPAAGPNPEGRAAATADNPETSTLTTDPGGSANEPPEGTQAIALGIHYISGTGGSSVARARESQSGCTSAVAAGLLRKRIAARSGVGRVGCNRAIWHGRNVEEIAGGDHYTILGGSSRRR